METRKQESTLELELIGPEDGLGVSAEGKMGMGDPVQI